MGGGDGSVVGMGGVIGGDQICTVMGGVIGAMGS